jgi:hypothetical protein
MDNEAFSENPEYELSRILEDLSKRVYDNIRNTKFFIIRDINGNKIGEVIINHV